MSSASVVRSLVEKYPDGQIFSYDDIDCDKAAAVIELSRLYKKGVVQKLAKGRFYKAKKGIFGPLRPNDQEIIQSYEKAWDGYETGLIAFNRLGLTTQIPSIIEITTSMTPRIIVIGNIKIKLVSRKKLPKKANIQLLQILDAIRQITKIPDTTPSQVLISLKGIIDNLGNEQKKELVKLALDFTPRTRALVGALFDELGYNTYTIALKKSLNSTTSYKLGIGEDILKYRRNWKIL